MSIFSDVVKIESGKPTLKGDANIVACIDLSGSTRAICDCCGKMIYKKEIEIFCRVSREELNVKNVNCVFFSAENDDGPLGKHGGAFFENIPYSTSNPDALISGAEEFVRQGRTETYLALKKIPDEVLAKPNTIIFIICDGNMDNGTEYKFSEQINRICRDFPDVCFSVIAVELYGRDYSKETDIVGCDIFNAIKKNSLTDKISTFRVYSPNNQNGFELFFNARIPLGYVPWGNDKMFLITDEEIFMTEVSNLIENSTEREIYSIMRKLTKSVSSIIKQQDISPMMEKCIIRSYSSLFNLFKSEDTSSEELREMFIQSVSGEICGQAQLSNQFLIDKKRRFALANEQLKENAIEAVGTVGSKCMTLPIEGKCYRVPRYEVHHSSGFSGMRFSSCKTQDGKLVQAIPIERRSTPVTDQCLRQFMRETISRLYPIELKTDICKFAVLCIALQVYHSNLPKEIKNGFVDIAITMEKKTLAGKNIIELDFLCEGNPHPSGRGSSYLNDLSTAFQIIFKKKVDAQALWFTICKMLDTKVGDRLSRNQLRFLKNLDVERAITSIVSELPRLELIDIQGNEYDYHCPLFMESTVEKGGWIILPHSNSSGECKPLFVISDEGAEQLFKHELKCLYCRSSITRDLFSRIDPPKSLLIETATTDVNHNKNYHIIFMRGTVGCGKTTFSDLIEKEIVSKGGLCISVGVDKYCKNGFSIVDAVLKIKAEISAFQSIPGNLKVLVVDSCGEKIEKGNVFGVSLDWESHELFPNLMKDNLKEYMIWSLRNVLRREMSSPKTNYWLNPQNAGIKICIDVHDKKAKALFGAKATMTLNEKDNVDLVIKELDEKADEYQNKLDSPESQVKNYLEKIEI